MNNQITRKAVLTIRTLAPDRKAATIARDLGVSRQCICIHLKKLNLPTTLYHPIKCQDCGKIIGSGKRCKGCWNKVNVVKMFELQCEGCDKLFLRPSSLYNRNLKLGYKHIWCSKKCQGKWLGSHFGRGRNDTRRDNLITAEVKTSISNEAHS